MKDLQDKDIGAISGGFWPAILAAGAVAGWAWANRADLMEVGDAAALRNSQLNSEH